MLVGDPEVMDCNLLSDAEITTMKWRRGLVLASIHSFIATSLIIWEIVPRYSTEKLHSQKSHFALRLAAYQEDGGTVEFIPICENWRSQTWQEKILGIVRTPRRSSFGLELRLSGTLDPRRLNRN
jgi:hypothetical protein